MSSKMINYIEKRYNLDPDLAEYIRDYAKEKEVSMSGVVRKFLWKGIAEWKGEHNGYKYHCRQSK